MANAALVVPPQDVINQKICTEYWNQPVGDYEMIVGGSASICQSLGEQLGTFDVKPPPHQICLNGTMSNVKVSRLAISVCQHTTLNLSFATLTNVAATVGCAALQHGPQAYVAALSKQSFGEGCSWSR